MLKKVNTSSLKENELQGILVKTTHQKVLSLFLAHPTCSFYGSEISQRAGISIGQMSKVLNDLFKAGLVTKERRGKTELYNIVAESPPLKTYKVLNTILSITSLVKDLKEFSKRVVLYGSCAKGTNIEESDLDLLVVSSKREKILDALSRHPSDNYYGFSEIRPVIKKPSEWAVLEENDPVFFNEVQKGILLFEREIDESRL